MKKRTFTYVISVISLPLILTMLFACRLQRDYGVKVFPSHISFTVDEETFAELRQSDFLLNRFAGTSVKTLTVDSGISWTGVYVYGRNTYLEFYSEEEDSPAGSCSIAFEVVRKGELKRFKDQLEKEWKRSVGEIELRTKVSDGVESPWFYYLDLYGNVGSDSLSPWLLEWDPNVLAEYYREPTDELVDEKNARLDDPSFIAERIFENIIEIKTSLPISGVDDWSAFLKALGFRRRDKGDVVSFTREDLIFHFLVDSKAPALELKMSLLREDQSWEEYNFGKWLRLKNNKDKTASLFFAQIRNGLEPPD